MAGRWTTLDEAARHGHYAAQPPRRRVTAKLPNDRSKRNWTGPSLGDGLDGMTNCLMESGFGL
jgi:hypothetical protein